MKIGNARRPRWPWKTTAGLLILLGWTSFCTPVAAAPPRDYYFSPSGNDAAPCTQARPCATAEHASALDLAPGDRLLFEGGQTFAGSLDLGPEDGGTPTQPVAITSYGAGRATLDAGDSYGLSVYNAGGIEVSRLVVTGAGAATNSRDGISFYMDLGGGAKLEHLRLDSVDVSGFGRKGLVIGAWNGQSGFRDVRVTRSAFYGNRDAGMSTYGEMKGALEDIYVGYCRFYDNPGNPAETNNSGSGVVLAQVDGGTIERSVAFGNGTLHGRDAPKPSNGPVGIWTYESNDITIQHNEAYGNRTASGLDGGGFDLDGGTTNSVLQYNYSHDNDGAGFLLAQYAGASAHTDNAVRYNISENDGRKNSYGSIAVWGASSSDNVVNAAIYNNTVYVSPAQGGSPKAVEFLGSNVENLTLRNNAFVTGGGVSLIQGPNSAEIVFQGNSYWSSEAAFDIQWGGVSYGSLATWRQATGQETHGDEASGLEADPQLTAPGAGGTVGDPDALHTLDAYQLRPDSPLAEAGFDLQGTFGTAPGPRDFYGSSLQSANYDIGAHEQRERGTTLPVELTTFEAAAMQGGVILRWATASETSNARFDIEHKTVGAFQRIASVQGAGTTAQAQRYRYHARDLRPSTHTFRLKQVDADGRSTYSEEVSVTIGLPALHVLTSHPNPFRNVATVTFGVHKAAPVSVTLYNALGQRVRTLYEGVPPADQTQTVRLDASGLASGLYVVRFTGASFSTTRRMIRIK